MKYLSILTEVYCLCTIGNIKYTHTCISGISYILTPIYCVYTKTCVYTKRNILHLHTVYVYMYILKGIYYLYIYCT